MDGPAPVEAIFRAQAATVSSLADSGPQAPAPQGSAADGGIIESGAALLWDLDAGLAPSSPSAEAGPSLGDANTDEDAAIQALLNGRYAQSDVKYSFTTKYGQIIDCVDYFAFPAVKAAMAAQSAGASQLPQPPPTLAELNKGRNSTLSDDEFNGALDQNGNSRACPPATSPVVRITPDAIRNAGGLDRFTGALRHKGPAPSFPVCVPDAGGGDVPGYAHVYAMAPSISTGNGYNEVQDYTSIFQPAVPTGNFEDHSLSQMWLTAGSCWADDGASCTKGVNCLESIEVGWTVDPVLNANFTNPSLPGLFIFSTADGYQQPGDGCYNGNWGNEFCLTWTPWPGATLGPGVALTPSSFTGGTQHQIGFYVESWELSSGLAWVVSIAIDNGPFSPIGYYPASDFGLLGGGTAWEYEVGGEVLDALQVNGSSSPGWAVPMGSGTVPMALAPPNYSGGYGLAAYHYNYDACYYDVDSENCNSLSTVVNSQAGPTNVEYSYTYDYWDAPGSDTWTSWFYFGDAPHGFWGSNYGYNWSPTSPTDWDNGYYKGECNVGVPIVGASRDTGDSTSHAILCGTTQLSSSGSGCYFRSLGSQGDTGDGNWDPNMYLTECQAGEFISGIAQSTSGDLNGVLCCPGQVNHHTCTQEWFYDGNSSGFSGNPDWDYGYYKGQCPAGDYAAGLSSPMSGYGTVGSEHALLCCAP